MQRQQHICREVTVVKLVASNRRCQRGTSRRKTVIGSTVAGVFFPTEVPNWAWMPSPGGKLGVERK